MTTRKRKPADLTASVGAARGSRCGSSVGSIRPPVEKLILTGSAATEAEALALRDGFRKQVTDHTAVRTNVTLRVLLAEWLAGHQVEPSTRAGYALLIDNFIVPALGEPTLPALAKLGPRPYERLFADLGACRRLRWQALHRAPDPAAARVRRPMRDAFLPSTGGVDDPPVPRGAQQRVRGGRAVGMDRVQSHGGRAEAASSGA